MDSNLNLPLEAIEGIGPRMAELLSAAGLRTVKDFLRVAPDRIHEPVKAHASIAQVRTWVRMCALLQVEGISPQWAEALAKAGVEDLEEFARRPAAALRTLFQEARAAHLIAEEPESDELSRMQVDAARVWMGLSLSGIVRSADNSVVANCSVRVGSFTTQTDPYGAFRITRIPAWSVPEVTLDHPEHLLEIVRLPRLLASNVLHTRLFSIRRLEPGATRIPNRISQLDGDDVPSLNGRRFKTEEVRRDQLRSGDILQLHSFYATAPDAKLVSKFLDLVDGVVHVRWVRVPKSELPPDAGLGSTFRLAAGGFVKIRLDARKLEAFVKLQRAKRAIRLLPQPRNADELEELFPLLAEELARAGIFTS
jgi:predicted flap endonuclease-1-like 5' DNA nuclease